MKLFLSYDSEQFALAESLAGRLQAAGHDVFLDREDLLPGEPFDAHIAARLAASDAMIFLASSTSVAAGSYALSELKLAERHWPRPQGRLIGVLLDGLAIGAVPAYLRSVSLLQPQGDVVAEVVHAVEALAERRRRRRLVLGAAVLAGAATIAVGAWLSNTQPGAGAAYAIVAAQVEPAGESWRLRTTLRNGSERRLTTVGLALEADRPGVRFPSSQEWFDVHARQTLEHTLPFDVVGAAGNTGFQWRACWRSVDALDLAGLTQPPMLDTLIAERGRQVCTPLRAWPAAAPTNRP
jgi:hypothetical protein